MLTHCSVIVVLLTQWKLSVIAPMALLEAAAARFAFQPMVSLWSASWVVVLVECSFALRIKPIDLPEGLLLQEPSLRYS